MQQLAQGREYAAALPALPIADELLLNPLPGGFVPLQSVELGQGQAQGGGGQGGAQGRDRIGVAHGFEPIEQVAGLGAAKDAVAVGEIHTGQATLAECLADGAGFIAVAHQAGDVAGPEGGKRVLCLGAPGRVHEAGLPRVSLVEPGGNTVGAGTGGFSQVGLLVQAA